MSEVAWRTPATLTLREGADAGASANWNVAVTSAVRNRVVRLVDARLEACRWLGLAVRVLEVGSLLELGDSFAEREDALAELLDRLGELQHGGALVGDGDLASAS